MPCPPSGSGSAPSGVPADSARGVVGDAVPGEERAAWAFLQRRLAARNARRLRPTISAPDRRADLVADLAEDNRDRLIEESFLAAERRAIAPLLRDLPSDPAAFVTWFEQLRVGGPGQNDPLFPWLAEKATLAEMRWFLGQEVAGEAGFDDLLALTQLKMPPGIKLEMARNYWDEMGRGQRSGMHGLMLDRLASAVAVTLPAEQIVWESLALSNLMVGLAWNRHYAYQAIGALGVIELTASGRSAYVNAGLRRLSVSGAARKYFAVHATLDVAHAATWNREVILPLASQGKDTARAMAEGALLRLTAGARCFERYRRELGFPDSRVRRSAPAH